MTFDCFFFVCKWTNKLVFCLGKKLYLNLSKALAYKEKSFTPLTAKMPNSVRTHTNTYSKKGIKSRCDLGASGIMDIVENIDQGPMLKTF